MIRVLLVDDQALLRMGFRLILEAEPDIEVVGEAGDGATGGQHGAGPAARRGADGRPDAGHGRDRRRPRAITAAGPDSRVLILTTFDLDEYVFAGLKAGRQRVPAQGRAAGELLAAIRTVAAGDAVLAPPPPGGSSTSSPPLLPDPGRQQDRDALLSKLTDRERTVFAELAAGRSNREIAAGLHLSEGTVKIHVGRILAKLGLRDRVQAVVLAYESGLITPGS